MVINKFSTEVAGIKIRGDGTFIHGQADEAHNTNAITANIATDHALQNSLHSIWPLKLAPEARRWVTANITGGIISGAEAHFNIAPGDLDKKDLPKQDVDAKMTMEGNNIRYLPDHPPMTDMKGILHIDGSSLHGKITSASFMKQTALSAGTLDIDDLT